VAARKASKKVLLRRIALQHHEPGKFALLVRKNDMLAGNFASGLPTFIHLWDVIHLIDIHY
jgi:hypothetical protein